MSFEGKIALVTGASRGIGRAIAETLVARGAKVIGTATSESGAQAISDYLGANGKGLMLNVTDPASIESVLENVRAEFGEVDILVNNSGGPKPGTFREISEVDMDDAYHAVLKYNIRMIRLCLPYMEQKGWGRIVNITSITVKEPAPNMVLSNIFRTAVASYARTISKELIAKGITINNVAPGYFKTDRVTQLMKVRAEDEGVSVEEYEQKAIEAFPKD